MCALPASGPTYWLLTFTALPLPLQMRLEGPAPAQQPAAAAPAAQQPPPGDDPKKKAEEERRKEAEKDLPEGWAVAFDAQKKPYFWHKQVRWTGGRHIAQGAEQQQYIVQ